jgi:hypothetical protein
MSVSKQLAPARIMSMSPAELAAYNKQQTKKFMLRISAAVIIPVAGVVALEIIGKIVDKKLEEHYTDKQND